MTDWERGFYESAFTHANVGRLTRHKGGFEGLWSSLAGERRLFPLATLIVLPQKEDGQVLAEPSTMRGLFDVPAPVSAKPTPPADPDEEAEILAEIKQDEETEEEDEAVVAS